MPALASYELVFFGEDDRMSDLGFFVESNTARRELSIAHIFVIFAIFLRVWPIFGGQKSQIDFEPKWLVQFSSIHSK